MIGRGLREILGTDRVPPRFREWMDSYPAGEQLNFLFDPEGGRRIYLAGSYPAPGLIDVAGKTRAYLTLLQVLPGRGLSGREEQTARLAAASGCSIAVPQHHDPLVPGAVVPDLSRLQQLLTEKHITLQEFVPGQWYEFA
jgi:hypothetical protein